MQELPILEHTSNETGRLLMYHIQRGDNDFNKFFLYKTAIITGGILEPEGVVFITDDYFSLHDKIICQGFVAMQPTTDDDPRILMVFL